MTWDSSWPGSRAGQTGEWQQTSIAPTTLANDADGSDNMLRGVREMAKKGGAGAAPA